MRFQNETIILISVMRLVIGNVFFNVFRTFCSPNFIPNTYINAGYCFHCGRGPSNDPSLTENVQNSSNMNGNGQMSTFVSPPGADYCLPTNGMVQPDLYNNYNYQSPPSNEVVDDTYLFLEVKIKQTLTKSNFSIQ